MLPNPTFFEFYVSVVELIWLIFGLVGLVYAIINVRDAYQDKTAIVRAKRNGYLLAIADASKDTEIARFLVQATIVVIGIYALTQKGPDKLSYVGFAVTIGFLMINICTGWQSYRIQRLRRKLDGMEHNGNV